MAMPNSGIPIAGVIGGEDEQSENQQVCESLGILRAIHSARRRREKIPPGCRRPWDLGRSFAPVPRRSHRRIDSLRRHKPGSRSSPLQTGCETRARSKPLRGRRGCRLAQSGLPQVRQNATAAVSLCAAQFIRTSRKWSPTLQADPDLTDKRQMDPAEPLARMSWFPVWL